MIREILSNGFILVGEELELVRGFIVIKDGVVDEISEGSPQRRSTDLKQGFVIPPFVNAHTHVVDSVAKELYLGKNQPQVVGPNGEKFRAMAASSPREISSVTRATLMDMIGTGTLAYCDFREGGASGVDILRRISPPHLRSIILGRFEKIDAMSKVLSKADGIGLPSLEVFDDRLLREISKITLGEGKLLATHAAEVKGANESSIKKFGCSEVERAIDLNCSFVVHATHASKGDFSKLRMKNTPVVFCPRSNSILGVGVPPIHIALETETGFFLGTDNAMSNQPNMFEELSFTWACLRRVKSSSGAEEARSILRAATVWPAEFFNLPWSPIAEGGSATFVVLARGNNLLNLSDVYAGLLNRARADNMRAVYLNGKMIIR